MSPKKNPLNLEVVDAQSNEIINRNVDTASNSFMLLAVFIEYHGKYD